MSNKRKFKSDKEFKVGMTVHYIDTSRPTYSITSFKIDKKEIKYHSFLNIKILTLVNKEVQNTSHGPIECNSYINLKLGEYNNIFKSLNAAKRYRNFIFRERNKPNYKHVVFG